jgi:hypothetical protein
MVKDYKYKLQKHKSYWTGAGAMCLSLVTGPLYTIGLAMQLSVLPHLTIYGDVKPEDIPKYRSTLRVGADRVAGLIGQATGTASLRTDLVPVDKTLID